MIAYRSDMLCKYTGWTRPLSAAILHIVFSTNPIFFDERIGLPGFFNLVIWAFVTDVIDYHEYLTDLREDATVYSIYSMARKIGQAVAGGVGGFAIGAVGYKSALDVQSAATLEGIYSLATLVPAIMYLIIFLIMMFLYPLNKKRTMQLAADLKEKRKQYTNA